MYNQDTDATLLAKGQRVIINEYDNTKTAYSFRLREDKNLEVIALMLWDESKQNGGRSITNSAERVLKDVITLCPQVPNIVVYKDNSGRWDRIFCLPDARKRLRFVSIGPIRRGSPALWEDCLIFNICIEVFINER
ncbi:hypothetical protein L4C54_12385 [Vibrio lamellibrachiae]|uniref:hypothetical protein n=1 Tax=Vibrio lamellibrachiae TaxID=2910253 RepID=UPI003D0C21E3